MSTSLIIVGKSLKINKPFLDYIDSQVALHIGTPDQKIFLDKSETALFESLESTIKKSDQTLVMASADSFNLIGKILSTLSEDVLKLKGSTLVPSNSKKYSDNSYLLEYQGKSVNLLRVDETKKLPKIFLACEDSSTLFSLIGLDEDSTNILLEPLADTYEIKLTSTSIIEGWSLVEAASYKYGNLESFLKSVKSLFPEKFIRDGDILTHIIESLKNADKTVVVAESCTGGTIASMITSISGSSKVFKGGIISYSNNIKKAWLGVSSDTLKTYGAVSELCVREMLEGALKRGSSDFAIASSGIVGPTGGSLSIPVGTVFIGVRSKNGDTLVERLLLSGDREYMQKQSCFHAFRLLLQVGGDIFFQNLKSS